LKRLPLPQGQMSLRPTPAKFSDWGRLKGGRTGAAGLAAAAGFAAFACAALLGALFFLAIAGHPTRRWQN